MGLFSLEMTIIPYKSHWGWNSKFTWFWRNPLKGNPYVSSLIPHQKSPTIFAIIAQLQMWRLNPGHPGCRPPKSSRQVAARVAFATCQPVARFEGDRMVVYNWKYFWVNCCDMVTWIIFDHLCIYVCMYVCIFIMFPQLCPKTVEFRTKFNGFQPPIIDSNWDQLEAGHPLSVFSLGFPTTFAT